MDFIVSLVINTEIYDTYITINIGILKDGFNHNDYLYRKVNRIL